MDNNLYNLMLQLTQEQKSIWRIGKYYVNDAGGCEECRNFWQNLKTDKENLVRQMKDLIKKHLG
ncbi:MAG: hypothetical protein ACOZAL_00695 [Patescibacteria group bacterium]